MSTIELLDVNLITIGKIEDFKFDDRLLREKKKYSGGWSPLWRGQGSFLRAFSCAYTITKDLTTRESVS